MLSKGANANSSNASTTNAGETPKRETTVKKAKTPEKLALDLVQKGALKIVEADSLTQQLIANNVYPSCMST